MGEELIQYQYNLRRFLSNLSKIIASQKTADKRKKKILKIDENSPSERLDEFQ